jgi:hypothetical protein
MYYLKYEAPALKLFHFSVKIFALKKYLCKRYRHKSFLHANVTCLKSIGCILAANKVIKTLHLSTY